MIVGSNVFNLPEINQAERDFCASFKWNLLVNRMDVDDFLMSLEEGLTGRNKLSSTERRAFLASSE